MNDLVDFLWSFIMTTSQIDKKYREMIPHIISEMKTLVDTSDDGKPKRRATRKMKLGRDGLYPEEDVQIRRWWDSNKPELRDDQMNIPETLIQSHISLLRTRETELQMILIFEILALEPLVSGNADDSQLPGLSPPEPAPPKKRKKKQDLAVLVDVHADRLCIWQSTASDELRLLEDSQLASDGRDGQKAQKVSSEPLRDFCVDVIMPL
jgi:DNA replication regulator SLD3